MGIFEKIIGGLKTKHKTTEERQLKLLAETVYSILLMIGKPHAKQTIPEFIPAAIATYLEADNLLKKIRMTKEGHAVVGTDIQDFSMVYGFCEEFEASFNTAQQRIEEELGHHKNPYRTLIENEQNVLYCISNFVLALETLGSQKRENETLPVALTTSYAVYRKSLDYMKYIKSVKHGYTVAHEDLDSFTVLVTFTDNLGAGIDHYSKFLQNQMREIV